MLTLNTANQIFDNYILQMPSLSEFNLPIIFCQRSAQQDLFFSTLSQCEAGAVTLTFSYARGVGLTTSIDYADSIVQSRVESLLRHLPAGVKSLIFDQCTVDDLVCTFPILQQHLPAQIVTLRINDFCIYDPGDGFVDFKFRSAKHSAPRVRNYTDIQELYKCVSTWTAAEIIFVWDQNIRYTDEYKALLQNLPSHVKVQLGQNVFTKSSAIDAYNVEIVSFNAFQRVRQDHNDFYKKMGLIFSVVGFIGVPITIVLLCEVLQPFVGAGVVVLNAAALLTGLSLFFGNSNAQAAQREKIQSIDTAPFPEVASAVVGHDERLSHFSP